MSTRRRPGDQTVGAPQINEPDHLHAAATAAGWDGLVVVGARLLGLNVSAVVEMLPAGWQRASAAYGAILDRPTLSVWEVLASTGMESRSDGSDLGDPGRPVRIQAFVSTRPWRQAIDDLRQLNGVAPGIVVRRVAPDRVAMADADYHGLTVVAVSNNTSRVVVQGRRDRLETAGRTVTVRLLEETLFGLALERGLLTTAALRNSALVSGGTPS
ncbi:hypothetical protein ACFV9C_30930 [Kribbella sp. NPDC059898]|uniref:hypothetical protein n=1 Tax=Kribbella sp. NPDC059898 TaxID=3346995 RepID=UPI003665D956